MGMILNPDLKKREEIQKAIKDNDGYCPCYMVKSEKTKCECEPMRLNNICICGLYVNKPEQLDLPLD